MELLVHILLHRFPAWFAEGIQVVDFVSIDGAGIGRAAIRVGRILAVIVVVCEWVAASRGYAAAEDTHLSLEKKEWSIVFQLRIWKKLRTND